MKTRGYNLYYKYCSKGQKIPFKFLCGDNMEEIRELARKWFVSKALDVDTAEGYGEIVKIFDDSPIFGDVVRVGDYYFWIEEEEEGGK